MALAPVADTFIEYGGFKFPQYHRLRTTCSPVNTPSNRSVRFLRVTVTIETWLTYDVLSSAHTYGDDNTATLGISELVAGQKLDTASLPLMQLLSTPGLNLQIRGLGMGDVDINNNSSGSAKITDLDNGPHPVVVELTNFVNARAYRLVWTVSFAYSPCGDKTISKVDPTYNGFDFAINYMIGEDGMITRNIYGSVTIFNFVRNGKPAINLDLAEDSGSMSVRKRITDAFPIPVNFHRTANYTTSDDRTKLQFSLTDTEINSPNAYHKNTLRMNVTHSISFTNPAIITQTGDKVSPVQNVLAGTIEVAPGYDKSWGWVAITSIILNRLNILPKDASIVAKSRIIKSFSLSTGLYDRTVSFSFSWQEAYSLTNFIKNSRVFFPLSEKWSDWSKSREGYQTSYGYDGAETFKPDSQVDRVITVCNQEGTSEYPVPDDTTPTPHQNQPPSLFPGISSSVTQDESYLVYVNDAVMMSDYNAIMTSTIGEGDAIQVTGTEENTRYASDNSLYVDVRTQATPENIQIRGSGDHYVVLRGGARRVKYPVVIPEIESVGANVTAPVLVSDRIVPSRGVGYTADGIPIYGAEWERVYFLPDLNRRVDVKSVPPIAATPSGDNFRLT